jgi:DNA-directed RNA polymerase subunit M/transcription elongation factor TFIIS
MDCPECGGRLADYRLGDRDAVACEDCGYVDIDAEHRGRSAERESWDDAIARFRRRHGEEADDERGDESNTRANETASEETATEDDDTPDEERAEGQADDETRRPDEERVSGQTDGAEAPDEGATLPHATGARSGERPENGSADEG